MVCYLDCPIAMTVEIYSFCTPEESWNVLSTGAYSTGVGENTREYGWWTPTGYNTQPLCRSWLGPCFYNGYSSSTGVSGVRLPSTMHVIRVNFRAESTGGVVFSIRDVKFVTEADYSRRDSNVNNVEPSYIGIIELRITECGKLVFTFGHNVVEIMDIELGEWTNFKYTADGNSSFFVTTTNNDIVDYLVVNLEPENLVGG
jgi:hypothetical protein